MDALLAVDNTLFNNAHKTIIENIFQFHGIPNNNSAYVNDTFEGNNGCHTAYPIETGKSYQSYISLAGDLDYYKLTIDPKAKGEKLNASLSLPFYGQDYTGNYYYAYTIVYFNSDRQYVKEADTGTVYMAYDINNTIVTKNETIQLEIDDLQDDVYYLAVLGYSVYGSYNTFTSSSPYTLSVKVVTSGSGIVVKAFPNPCKGEDAKAVINGFTENSKLAIYDIKGRLVFNNDDLPDTVPYWEWDTKDNNGKKVPSGIYIIVIKNDQDKAFTGKLAIIR